MTRWFQPAPGMATLLMLLSAHAMAQEEELKALELTASEAVRYDSNLFRRNTNKQSETLTSTTVGVEIDKQYSLQRVELDASVSARRYRSNDYLNFNAVNYRAAWHWSFTPRLTGLLSHSRNEDINTFDYYRSFDRNIRTEHKTTGTVEAAVGRDWRLIGGIEREERSNERPTAELGDYTQRNLSVGVMRLFPSGSSIRYRMLEGNGDYFNRLPGVTALPSAFDQREHELRVSWSGTSKTTLNATVGYVDRTHPGVSIRDFSGARGSLSVQWRATVKTGMQLTLARGIGAYQTNTSSYSTSNRIALYPYWTLGPRTLLYGSVDHSIQSFAGALPGFVADNRQERSNTVSLGMRWQPFNALSLNATLGREWRNSNVAGFEYTNTSARVAARFAF